MSDDIQKGRKIVLISSSIFILPYVIEGYMALRNGVLIWDKLLIYIIVLFVVYKGCTWVKYIIIGIQILTSIGYISSIFIFELNPIIKLVFITYGIVVLILSQILMKSERVDIFLKYQKSKRKHIKENK